MDKYPTQCQKCQKPFKPGDDVWYDILDGDGTLDDLCGECAKDITLMSSYVLPGKAKDE
jgi:hypothetical protein